MLSSKRKRARGLVSPVAGSLAVALAVAAAGCSSDVTRFKLGGGGTVGSIPLPNEPVSPTSYSKGPPGHGSVIVTETDLSAAEPPDNYQPIGRGSNFGRGQPPPTLGAQPKHKSDLAAGGATIEVQRGDSIFNIARRYGVAPAAIKEANGLTSDSLQPGQRLFIPGANGASDGDKVGVSPPKQVKITPIPVNPAPIPASAHPGWEGTYAVKHGDTLYGIASEHKVSVEDLKRVNGITDPTKVGTGKVLMVPSRPGAVAKGPPPAQQKGAPPRVEYEKGAAEKSAAEKASKQPERPTPPPQAEIAGKFRWPVRGNGRLIVGYGKRPDGTHNDGINLAVPHGTDIFAVEGGKVAYAGSELKGYGNLILIRHSNKWVSAYAHADQVLVRSGDEVKKGQIIAKAGKTGSVDQPQLHFELRQDSRPVDPLPHLASAN